jgi:hypothetical protein
MNRYVLGLSYSRQKHADGQCDGVQCKLPDPTSRVDAATRVILMDGRMRKYKVTLTTARLRRDVLGIR